MEPGRVGDDRRESVCPECHERGSACCVVVGHGMRTLRYVCLGCHREWHHAEVMPDLPWLVRGPRPQLSHVLNPIIVGPGRCLKFMLAGRGAYSGPREFKKNS